MKKVEKMEDLIIKGDLDELKKLLEELHPVDIAEALSELKFEEVLHIFRKLDFNRQVQVLDHIDSEKKFHILVSLEKEYAGKLISEMSQDVLVDFLGDLNENKRRQISKLLHPKLRVQLKNLMAYEKNTAGGRMTTEYIAFPSYLKAKEILDKLEKLAPDAETIYYIYVIDDAGRLVGVVSLRDLILAPEDSPIRDIMRSDVKKINASSDQEEATKLIKKYGFLALPVVDDKNVLLGIVTVDDAMQVEEEETTEDIFKLSGSDFEQSNELSKLTPWTRAKRRLPWILVAVAGEFFSGSILNKFSIILQTIVALTFFIPVLMSMGGNVGTQSAAIIVRGLATEQINPSLLVKNVFRETAVGAMLGLFNGLLISVIAYLWQGQMLLGAVVGIAMAVNITLAAMLGSFMPLLWHKLGYDPAVASGPLVTTILDVIGLFIYFTTALWILKL